ncbi:MAG TPA: PD-(D/E)XK nuclease family protein, partial [bacterium]|nr:PD-(D/E)XK nuclease family protein [bacterium]
MRTVTAPDFETLRVRVAREIAAVRAEDALAPVRVVAPGESARRGLRSDLAARLGGTLAVRVTSWPRWVDELARPAVTRRGGRDLGEAGFDQLVASVLEERAGSPDSRRDPLLRIAGTPGLVRSVAATFRDLLEGGLTADDADPRLADRDPVLASLFRAYRAFLDARRDRNLWDRRRREELAADRLARGAADPRQCLLLFGFHDLTPLQRAIVAAADGTVALTLLVPGPAGRAGSEPGEGAASPLLQWAAARGPVDVGERAAPPAFTVTDGLFDVPTLSDPGSTLELVTFPTEAAEVRGLAGRIRDELRAGRSPDACLVTLAPGGPPPELFRRVLRRAGVPLDDRVGVPGHRTAEGRHALVLARGLSSPDDDDRAALELLPDLSPDPSAGDAAVSAFRAARTAADVVARFRELVVLRLGPATADAIDEALEAIRVVRGTGALGPREFASALGAALSAVRVRRRPDGPAVRLVSISAARFERRSLVFHVNRVVGASGAVPPADPLLSDRARRRLNDLYEHAGRHLAVREDRREEQVLLARFATEAAVERTVISWSERARTGSEVRNPDGLLLDVANRRAGRPLEPGSPGFAAIVPPPDPERARCRPVDATDLDLALLAGDAAPTVDDLTRLMDEPRARHLGEAMRAAEARWTGPRLTAHDGVLTDERALRRVQRALASRSWSPTALERLANCPFSYLLRLLELDDERPTGDDYDPLDRGRIFHGWLERIYRGLLGRDELPLDPDRLPGALARLEECVAAEDAALRVLPRRHRLARRASLRALRDDVAILLAREAARPAAARTVPVRVEMTFGPDEDGNPGPSWKLADGGVPLRGKIDRVDRRPDGRLEVVDYKTGRPRARSGALRFRVDGKDEVRLQLPVYLEAVRSVLGVEPARATYAHATADHDFREIELTG